MNGSPAAAAAISDAMAAHSGSQLISAAWVFPIAAAPIRDGAIVLGPDGSTVISCGPRDALRRALPGGVPERRARGVLLPGLVNAHAHLELSAIATHERVAGGNGLVAWTRALLQRRAGVSTAANSSGHEPGATSSTRDPHLWERAQFDAAVAAARSARGFGTAAIADVGNGTSGWRALAALGFRGLFFHELVGSREVATGNALADAERERAASPIQGHRLDRAVDARNSSDTADAADAAATPAAMPFAVDLRNGDTLHIPAVPAPHAPYSVGPQLMRRIFATVARGRHPTSIHVAEDAAEIELLRDGRGAWAPILEAMGVPTGDRTPGLAPVAYLEALGAFGGPTPPLLVHMVHADHADLSRVAAADATVVLCPRSNLHIGARLPDVTAMIAAKISLAIGTDSLASVVDLSPWQEIATLAHHFPAVAPSVWLRAATWGGAMALGMGMAPGTTAPGPNRNAAHKGGLGAFLPGARPGVLDVDVPLETAAAAAGDDATALRGIERALVTCATPTVTWMATP